MRFWETLGSGWSRMRFCEDLGSGDETHTHTFVECFAQVSCVRAVTAEILLSKSQFARVVKGVDLRSTAGNCAWAQTPQLTFDISLGGV